MLWHSTPMCPTARSQTLSAHTLAQHSTHGCPWHGAIPPSPATPARCCTPWAHGGVRTEREPPQVTEWCHPTQQPGQRPAEAGVTRGDLCPGPLAVPAALAPAHKLQIKNCPALIKGIWAGTRHLLLCPDQLAGTAG